MQIIALDLATITGYCYGDLAVDNSMPQWGCFRLAGIRDLNRSFVGAYNEILTLLDVVRPDFVVYETPLTQSGRDRSRDIVDLLVGLAAVTRLVCHQHNTRVYEQTFAEVRKAVLGKGAFPRPFRGEGKLTATGKRVGDAKEEVTLWLRKHGWGSIDQPDAADAAVLYRYAQMICAKGLWITSPARSAGHTNGSPRAPELPLFVT